MEINKEAYRVVFKEVDETIGNIFVEFQDAINLLKNDKKFLRMRLLIAFSFVEVISGVFDRYYNLNLGNEVLMKRWFKDYCLTKNNEVFQKHDYLKEIDEVYLYKLRCSIIHAFSLPEFEGKNAIMFVNGNESNKNLDKYKVGFTKLGMKPVIISADSLTALFVNGAENLVKEIFIDESKAKKEDLEALERISAEFFRRGAKHIDLNK